MLVLLKGLVHHIGVLPWGCSGGEEGQAFFYLLTELLTVHRRGEVTERVNTSSQGALVGQEAGDSALVLSTSTTNEGRVVKQSVFGGIGTGLQGTAAVIRRLALLKGVISTGLEARTFFFNTRTPTHR